MSTMNTFQKITAKITDFPVGGINDDGEDVIIERGRNEHGEYVRTEALQDNNWVRINYYYENGDMEEMYERQTTQA